MTCTVTFAVAEKCGKPAVWSGGEFAECAEHAADPNALANHTPISNMPKVGDILPVARYGKIYDARVEKMGTVIATVVFTYGNGTVRRARVRKIGQVWS